MLWIDYYLFLKNKGSFFNVALGWFKDKECYQPLTDGSDVPLKMGETSR